MQPRPRSGFSLIEALVVLAISGMALAIIFTIGKKAGDTGFGLGRRAMAASESDIAISDLRTLIQSVALRPVASFAPEIDIPVLGTDKRFEADVVMSRANQCAPLGWAGRITVSVESDRGHNQLVCEADGNKSVLIDLGTAAASFSYSRDGKSWSPGYTNAPQGAAAATTLHSETVWVRFASPEFGDIVESATSGPPDAWTRISDAI